MATHPGLEFLQSTPEFQERYGLFSAYYSALDVPVFNAVVNIFFKKFIFIEKATSSLGKCWPLGTDVFVIGWSDCFLIDGTQII